MFKKITIKKRIEKISKVVVFKSHNPHSTLYGTFGVKENLNDRVIEYLFLGYKISKHVDSGQISFYKGSRLQVSYGRFLVEIENDIKLITDMLDEIDKKITYY
jgi:methyl coenzyme M reductase subunit D